MPHKSKKILLAGVENVIKSKVIGCNTLEVEYANGSKAIRYHNTDVITKHPNGDTVLTTGGWRTSTTKLRFNRQGFNVNSNKGIWYIAEPITGKPCLYFDGITFDASGKLISETKPLDSKKINATKKKIAKYVKLVDSLGKIPMPNRGDCWYCNMHTQEGNCLGDTTKDTSHLESHLEEGYLHGSIIYNALKEKGYKEPALIMQMNVKWSIKNALRRYLTKRLLPEVQAS